MADKTITDQDIEDTLRTLGIEGHALPHGSPGVRTDARELQETLRAAGIDATVTDKGVTFKDEGFNDTAEERAAMRLRRGVQRTTPPPGPGFDQPKAIIPTEKERALAEKRGYAAPFVKGFPVVGPTLEHGAAAVNALIDREPPDSTFGERQSRELTTSRNATKFFEQENPGGSLVAELGGALTGTLPLMATKIGGMAMGTYGPSTGSRVLTGTLGNAGINALDAALRGDNVGHGAMIGAAGGFAGPIIGEMARGTTNFAARTLMPRTGALADMHPGAINKLTAALEGETPGSLATGRTRMGPQGFLGDINAGMTDIAGGLADTPGSHKAIVREAYRVRDAGARSRIEQAATDAAGPPVNTVQFTKMTTEARKKAADPLYKQFRDTVIDPTAEIQALVPRLEKAGAFKMAEELAGVTGDKINLQFLGPDGAKMASPTAQTWDYVKRGLDRRIDAAYSGANPDRTLGAALVKLKNELIEQIENAPGGDVYRQARHAFQEHSSLLDQVKAGKDMFVGGRAGLSADELREELKGLSRPELSARIIGVRSAIKDTMGATFNGDTQMRNKFLAPNNIEKLELVLGKDRAKALIDSMHQEKFLKDQSQNVVHGSQTTPKRERVDALRTSPLPEWNPNLTQPLSWLPPAMLDQLRPSNVIDAWRSQGNNKAMNQLSQLVTMPEGPQMNDLIAALAGESRRRAVTDQRAGAVGNMLGGVISGPGTTTARRRYFRREEEPAQPKK